MLAEIRLENLAVISRAELLLSPGLNVITGETGAGKTILAHAISLLLGGRATAGLIRPGAREASVEAVFDFPAGLFSDLSAEYDLPDGEEMIVRRRISRDGRSRAYLDGRAANLGVMGQVVGRLLTFSAQHEQRRLMMASRQLQIVDGFGGGDLLDLKKKFGILFDRRAALAARREEVAAAADGLSAETELLQFQLAEIEAAALLPGEEGSLEGERRGLQAAASLREAAAGAASALESGSEEGAGGVLDSLAAALAGLKKLAGTDRELDAIAGRLENGFYELEELGRAARLYGDAKEDDPARLAEVEERLDLLATLKRKYGATIEEVVGFGDDARRRLESSRDAGGELKGIDDDLSRLDEEMAEMARELSRRRLLAARGLEKEAAAHLKELAFGSCRFEARLSPLSGDGGGFNRFGADQAEFFITANPGMPAALIREIASGGELSRIMLAIKSAAAAGEEATMVFDEIDAGIGGETGRAVGAKLKGLAAAAQVICITHLPQIACFADAHFSVVKQSGKGSTVTGVSRLAGSETVDELCRMMGSSPDEKEARRHAESLIRGAAGTAAGAPRREGSPRVAPRTAEAGP